MNDMSKQQQAKQHRELVGKILTQNSLQGNFKVENYWNIYVYMVNRFLINYKFKNRLKPSI